MGHGYNVVIAFGINIYENEISYESDESQELKDYLYNLTEKFPSLSFHYVEHNCRSVFITIKKKEIFDDVRGYDKFKKIDVDGLKPNKEEFTLLYEARKCLMGEKIKKINFAMFTYED